MPARSARHAALVVCAVVLWSPMRPAVAGDPETERGRQVFLSCQACHQVGPKARHRVGPSLNNIFGRRAGTLEGFNYSGSMRDAGQNGLVWNEAELSRFIEAPARHVPGTTMKYRGMPDEGDRTALVAFIRQHSPGPANLLETPPTEPVHTPAGDPDVPEHVLSVAGDPAYGEYLSGECVTCHQVNGEDKGIPSITGWPARQFVTVMHAYKSKHRENPVMRSIAASLTAEEIAALAAYFTNLEEEP